MKNSMLLKVFLAIALAVIAGLLTGPDSGVFGVTFLQIYNLIGQLFLNALSLVVVPSGLRFDHHRYSQNGLRTVLRNTGT